LFNLSPEQLIQLHEKGDIPLGLVSARHKCRLASYLFPGNGKPDIRRRSDNHIGFPMAPFMELAPPILYLEICGEFFRAGYLELIKGLDPI